jgi:hypothetical protein
MGDGEFAEILKSIDRRLKEVWEAIDDINKEDRKTEVGQTKTIAHVTERVAKIETQVTNVKWLFGILVGEILYIIVNAKSVF